MAHGRLGRRGHDAAGAARRLDASAGHARHGIIEPVAQPSLFAQEIRIGHEKIFEAEVKTVHPAITDRGNGPAGQSPACIRAIVECVAVKGGLFNEQNAQPLESGHAAGAGDNHQHTRFAGKGAPGLGTVQQPAAFGPGRLELEAGDVRAEVGFGDRDRRKRISGRDPGEPVRLLRFGAARQDRAGQDFGAGDEAACNTERGFGQRLCHRDHRQIVLALVRGTAAIAHRNRQAENPHLLHLPEQGVRDAQVVAMDFPGERNHDVLSKPEECIAHQVNIRTGLDPRKIGAACKNRCADAGKGLPATLSQQIGIVRGLTNPADAEIDVQIERDGFEAEQSRWQRVGQKRLCQPAARFRHFAGSQKFRGRKGQFVSVDLVRIEPVIVERTVGRAARGERRDCRVKTILKCIKRRAGRFATGFWH